MAWHALNCLKLANFLTAGYPRLSRYIECSVADDHANTLTKKTKNDSPSEKPLPRGKIFFPLNNIKVLSIRGLRVLFCG